MNLRTPWHVWQLPAGHPLRLKYERIQLAKHRTYDEAHMHDVRRMRRMSSMALTPAERVQLLDFDYEMLYD